MKIGTIDLDKEVLLIAEIGNNHEGNVDLAERMVYLAADAGAHVAKFQTIQPNRLVHTNETARIGQLNRFSLNRKDHERLARASEKAGIMFMSTPFHIDAVAWLNDLVPAFKIASGDNDFDPLIRAVAATGKPVVLSTGMCGCADVEHACGVIRNVWTSNGVSPGLSLLHCVSAYPAPIFEINLAAIRLLRPRCDAVGYSDHTIGIEAAGLSVAAGARVVEKHFTIDKNYSDFRDHRLSADPDEMKLLAERIRQVSKMMGEEEKNCQDCEQAVAVTARRSIVARHDLAAGQEITLDDLDWLRPAGGLSPRRTDELIGRRIICDVARGERLDFGMLN